MMIIHHIGYIVQNLEESINGFLNLGFSLNSSIIYDEIRKARICFLSNGGYCIELVAPDNEQSPIYGLLKKYKNCPYHICYCSNDLQKDIDTLCSKGWLLFSSPQSAPAIKNKNVVFLYNLSVGMIELVEMGTND